MPVAIKSDCRSSSRRNGGRLQPEYPTGSDVNEGFVCNLEMLGANGISVLQSICGLVSEEFATGERISKTASVKFMITMQDEKELCKLGYSQEQINRIKPQEVVEILQARTKAEQNEGEEGPAL